MAGLGFNSGVSPHTAQQITAFTKSIKQILLTVDYTIQYNVQYGI